jgi:hypothetical protein
MQRHILAYTLWVLCVDDETFQVLESLDLPNVRLLRLAELETPELSAARAGRSRGEYCWTLTPFAPWFVFQADDTVRRVTYIDADLWFIDDPSELFNEFDRSGKAVLITEHAYSPEFDRSPVFGKFCVQFLTFDRVRGESVRRDWAAKCLEWCFARVEDGKFGDQKYLDVWPRQFASDVHVLANKELLQAPWTAERFPLGNAVMWHFHGLRLASLPPLGFIADFGSYPLPRVVKRYVYGPYRLDLAAAVRRLRESAVPVSNQFRPGPTFFLRLLLSPLYRAALKMTNMNIGRVGQ